MSIATRKFTGAGPNNATAGLITPVKLSAGALLGRYAWYNGDHQPQLSAIDGYTDPTGTTITRSKALCGGTFPLKMDYFAIGTQTLKGPLFNTAGKGLEVTGDQTVDEGYEYIFGALDARGAHTIVVGAENAFMRVSFEIEDVSDLDVVACGWRKNETIRLDILDYDEAAYFDVVSGDIKTSTILNNAANVVTDTGQNWADGETHELMVKVIGRRVTYWIDGAPAPGTVEFNFDADEVIVPFFRTLLDDTGAADATSLVWWKEVEVGLLSDVSQNGDPS
jgi:hypothetical protein